jgi:hypothetical protein
MQYPQYGINRRSLDRILIQLGGRVRPVRRTGEIRYTHPLVSSRPRANKRRKDAPNHLVDFVREVMQRMGIISAPDLETTA